jgi:hypothetical protein
MSNLIMKDQAKRQLMLDEFDKHWYQAETKIIKKKFIFAFMLTVLLVYMLSIFIPVEANTAWKSVSDQSLVDMFGEE